MTQDILITPGSGEPQILFRGSGTNDTPIELNVLSSYQSANGSGTALVFEGQEGQLFAVTDNLSSGTIFSVGDITGLSMLSVDASGDVKLGEFANSVIVYPGLTLDDNVPSTTSNVLYNDGGDLMWNGVTVIQSGATQAVDGSGTASYVARFTDTNTLGTGIIYDNGTNVGIGTASPTQKLDVAGGIGIAGSFIDTRSANGSFTFSGTTTTRNLNILNQSDKTWITAVGNVGNNLILKAGSNTYQLYLAGDGNVGIDTYTPTQKLDIRYPVGGGMALIKSTDSNDGLLFGDMAYSTSNTHQGIKHAAMTGASDYMILSDGTNTWVSAKAGGTTVIAGGGNSADSHMKFSSTEVVVNDQGSSLDFRVESDNDANALLVDGITDNVGIGVSNPSYKLDTGLNSIVRVGRHILKSQTIFLANSTDYYIGTLDTLSNGDSATIEMTVRTTGTVNTWRKIQFQLKNQSGTNTGFNYSIYGGSGDINLSLKYINRSGDASKTDIFISTDASASYGYTSFVSVTCPTSTYSLSFIEDTGYSATGATSVDLDANLALALTSTGSVGIGTGSPSSKLSVVDTGTSNIPVVKLDVTGTASYVHSQQALAPNITAGQAVVNFIGRAASSKNAGYIGYLYSGSAGSDDNKLTFGHWSSNHLMVLDGAGKLGIGTTSPGQKLHISTTGHTELQIDAGVDSNPGVRLTNDAQNWVMRLAGDSSDQFQIRQITGTPANRLVIDTSGKVGIGADSPTQKLDIRYPAGGGMALLKSTDTTDGLLLGDVYSTIYQGMKHASTGANQYMIMSEGIHTFISANPNGYVYIRGGGNSSDSEIKLTLAEVVINDNGSSNDFRVESNNDANALFVDGVTDYVGIGTASPGAKLDVQSNTNAASIIRKYNLSGGSSAHAGVAAQSDYAITYILSHANARTVDRYGFAIGGYSEILAGGTNNGLLIGTSNLDNPIVFGNNSTERMRIAAGGNVGIGTASPSSKLHIVQNTASNVLLKLEQDNASYESYYEATSQDGGYSRFGIGSNANDYTFFNSDQSSYRWYTSSTPLMTLLTGNGNLGIGTTSPARTLDLGNSGQIGFGTSVANNNNQGIYWNPADTNYAIYRSPGTWTHPNYQQLTLKWTTGIVLDPGTTYGKSNVGVKGGMSIGSTYYATKYDNDGLIVQGNVGIGTTSPQQKLHIDEGNIRIEKTTDPTIEFNNGSANRASMFYDTSEETFVLNHTDADANQLVLTSGNNVGIGTNAPNATLHVYSAASGDNVFNVEGTNGSLFGVTDNLSGVLMSVNTIAGLPVLEVNSDYSVTAGRFNQNDFVITSSGDIGMGTASPSGKLDIRYPANGGMFLVKDTDSGDGVFIGDIGGGSWQGIKHISHTGANDFWIRASTDGDTIFSSKASTSLYLRNGGNNSNSEILLTSTEVIVNNNGSNLDFRVESDGNANMLFVDGVANRVGIGTALPSYTLDITGSLHSTATTRLDYGFYSSGANSGGGTAVPSQGQSDAYSISKLQLYQASSSNGSQWLQFGRVNAGNNQSAAWIGVTYDYNYASNLQFYTAKKGNNTLNPYESSRSMVLSQDFISMYTGPAGTGTPTERVRINSAGNVGIGETTPTQKLHVAGNLRLTGAFYDSNNAAGTSGQVLSSTATGTDWISLSEIQGVDGTGGAGQVAFWSDADTITGESNLYWDSSNDRLGIGTSSPTETLEVEDHSTNPVYAKITNSYSTGKAGIKLTTTYGGTEYSSYIWDDWVGVGTVFQASRDLNTGQGGFNWLAANGSSMMSLRRNGGTVYGLGVGGVNALVPLHVKDRASGSDGIRIDYGSDSSYNLRLDGVGGIRQWRGTGSNGGMALITSLTSGSWGGDQGGAIAFQPRDTEAARFDGLGNFGIGTASPAAKLDVNGQVRIDSVSAVPAGCKLLVGDVLQASSAAPIQLGGLVRLKGGVIIHDNTSVSTSFYLEYAAANGLSIYRNAGTGSQNILLAEQGGNVGIGTASPSEKLHVVGDAVLGTAVVNDSPRTLKSLGCTVIEAADANHRIILRGTQSTNGTITGNTNNMDFYEFGGFNFYTNVNTATSNRTHTLTMTAGKVGINTTSPQQKLHVVGDQRIENATDPKLEFHDGAAVGGYVKFDTSEDNLVLSHVDVAGDNQIALANDGNVGIGTASPNAVLHAYGSTPSGTVFNVEGTNGSLFSVVDNLSGVLMSVNNNAGLPVFEVNDDDSIVGGRFAQNDLVVTTSGDIGMGTANPASKLEVNGTVTATSFSGAGTGLTGTAASLTAGAVTNGVYTTGNQTVGGVKTFSSQIISTAANNAANGGGQIYLSGAAGNRIDFNNNGAAAPSFTTRSVGTKIVLYPGIGASSTDYAIGIESSTQWYSVPSLGSQFKWYAATTNVATLTGGGVLTVSGGTSQINVDNLRLDGNTLSSTNTNGNIIITPNGTGGIAAGASATVTGQYAVVGGGLSNTASSYYATVGGGAFNCAADGRSTVSGGTGNTASGYISTIGGGAYNCICSGGSCSTIGGGFENTASAAYSTVGGGSTNTACGDASTVSGGISNTASAEYSTVSGGRNNKACATNSSISGGRQNFVNARHGSINGGHYNVIQSPTNECCSRGATIGGGIGHNTSYGAVNGNTGDITGTVTCCNAGRFSTIGGGFRNIATGSGSTVGGGSSNIATGSGSTVGGGSSNSATQCSSTIGGGSYNCATGINSTVSGGIYNCATGISSTVSGGGGFLGGNVAIGDYSTIGGGGGPYFQGNTASGCLSIIGGGSCHTASGVSSTIGGGFNNITSACYSTVSGGYRAKASRYGEVAHAAGRFAQIGDAQHSTFVARKNTTDATANVELFLDGVDDRMILTAETTWTFDIKLSAYNDTDNTTAWWIIRGGIRRNAANGTTLIGSLIEERDYEGTMSGTSAAVTADDTNESLKIAVTGLASKNIRWVAVVDVAQVSWGTP